MKFTDYFLFKIYKTYRRFYELAPGVLREPPFMASVITAVYCSAFLISLAIRLNIWTKNAGFYVHFFLVFLSLLIYTTLCLYFEKRAKKAYYRFINESRSQKILGALFVNTGIGLIIVLFVTSVN